MPTPQQEAIDVIRQRFRGFNPMDPRVDDAPDAPTYDDPQGVLRTSAMRDIRAGELADRLPAEEAATLVPTEGYVQGEPGRRQRSNASAVMSAFLTRRRLQGLGEEAAADPFTGDAEQQRVRGVQQALDQAATTRRPELDDAAGAVASRNAFANFLNKRRGYEADISGEGTAALDAASRRKVNEAEALASGRQGNRPIIKDTPTGLQSIDPRTGMATPVTDDAGDVVRGHGLSATQQQKAAETSQAIGILDSLQFDFPNVQGRFQGMGPLSSKVSNFRQAFPLIPADQDWARFTSNTATLKNQTIKAITGAQMSQGEAQRIMAQLPTEDLKPEVWQERAAATRRNLSGLLKRMDLLARGVPASQLDQMPVDQLADGPSEADMADPNRGR